MRNIIQDWLGSRLGLVIDMSPANFGRLTKDGKLFAKLLYTYGVLPLQILNTIKPSLNVTDCYNNLKILKPWLEYLEVPVKDESLHEIASGEGTEAFHLVYALYLSLQHKDMLHYLCAEKERKYSSDKVKRCIKVERVPEKPPRTCLEDSEPDVIYPFIEKRYIIERHRVKCNEIVDKIKSMKNKRFSSVPDKKTESCLSNQTRSQKKSGKKRSSPTESTRNEINEFSEKFASLVPDLNYQELVDLQNKMAAVSPKPVPNFGEAKLYMNFIREKARRDVITLTFQEDMQCLVYDELRNSVRIKQNEKHEEIVCKNLLKQSQYEKQMCTKLALLRRQKDVSLKNRQYIERLGRKNLLQKEYEDMLNYGKEVTAEMEFDEEFERQRLSELHKRIYMKKVELKFRERHEEAKSILEKLTDIAVRISEFREAFACEIPKHLMKDMKELFFKDLPIFDIIEEVEELYKSAASEKNAERGWEDELIDYGEGEENYYGEGDFEDMFEVQEAEELGESGENDMLEAAEFIRQEALNECDFNDYLFLLGSWAVETLIPNDSENEGSQTVLGYIVHKMLASKYPLASVTVPAELKPMGVRAVVQGSSDESIFEMLSELLALQKILVFRVDDAINFVLKAYKNELSAVRDVDFTFQQATKNVLKVKGGTERTNGQSRKEQLLKTQNVLEKKVSEQEPFNKEVSTQTPRKIPEDNVLLSPNAETGKLAFESLGIGDPIPDSIIISAMIAYLASLQDEYDGWVLWNYPVFYSQASKLESTLTGYQLMTLKDEMNSVEEIEGFCSRSTCQNPHNQDDFAEKRISRLVPKPEENTIPENAVSYLTAFVMLRKKIQEGNRSNIYESSPWQDNMIQFYTEQEIFHSFDCPSITFQTVKDIGRVVLRGGKGNTENGIEAATTPSLEVFGEGVLELNEKYNPIKKKAVKDLKKPAETPKAGKIEQETPYQAGDVGEWVEKDETKTVNSDELTKFSGSMKRYSKPGDPGWEWVGGNQSEEVQLMLATFWEKLEAVYVEDFKYVFFCLRVHRKNVIKYKAILRKALQRYLRREDIKQNILSDFQHKFNDIDDDLRPDADVKSELHVRVSELEEALLEIADERKRNSEGYRMKFINDNWVADEMSNLVNLYIRALQLEADRCIDTCQFINDYYLSLQHRLPHENVLPKMYAPTLHIKQRSYSRISYLFRSLSGVNDGGASSKTEIPVRTSKASVANRRTKHDKNRATASKPTNSSAPQEIVALPNGVESINEILVNLSYTEDNSGPYHKFFLDTVRDLTDGVKDIAESCLAEATKAGPPVVGAVTGRDRRKTSDMKLEGNGHLRSEWTAALEAEINRFLYRMRIIQARGIADFNNLIWEVLNTLISLTEDIGEIYNREVESISECCKVIRCAIEEEIALQPRLELIVDEFVINRSVPLFPNPSVEFSAGLATPYFKYQFTKEQLKVIFKKLLYIAPNGEIVRRALLYILEDLRVIKCEDGIPRLFPAIWDELDPNDLPFVFDRVFQRIEIVNWKDFIVYALELPIPSDLEILNMRSAFHSYDPSKTELVCFKDFMSIDFWFESHNTRFDNSQLKEFLFKMYQVDEEYTNYTALLLAFCKDENPFLGFVKALTLYTGKRIIFDDYTDSASEEAGEQDESLEEGDYDFTAGSESASTEPQTKHKCKKYMKYSCGCKDATDIPSESSEIAEEVGETYRYYIHSEENLNQSLYTSVISRDVIKKVLLVAYPSFRQLSVLLNCSKTFELAIDSMLEVLNKDGSGTNVSGLLKHKFISRILTSTNKFKAVDMQGIVKSIVEKRQETIANHNFMR